MRTQSGTRITISPSRLGLPRRSSPSPLRSPSPAAFVDAPGEIPGSVRPAATTFAPVQAAALSAAQRPRPSSGGGRNPAHVHDLHATILHLLGLDHLKLTFKFQGRNFRLTDVAGDVIHKLIA